VIFMGNGGTKEGKDAIAQSLRHIPLVAMHGVHHEVQRGVDNRSCVFRVESFDERRGAFEIGKERGDRLALPIGCPPCFHGRLFGTNAFG
jgi:hypothetical protein